MMTFLSFLAGAILSPIFLLWLSRKVSTNQPTSARNNLAIAKRYLTLIADDTAEPKAAKIAAKALKEIA